MQPKPKPKHWLFQFNPSTYRWFDRNKETAEPEQWLISQLSTLIHRGDLVAVWGSGQKAGVYGLGEVLTNPAKRPLNPAQAKYFVNQDSVDKFLEHYSAMVQYSKVLLEKPLSQEHCSRDPVLSKMQIMANQQGTNFRLTYDEWIRIVELAGR